MPETSPIIILVRDLLFQSRITAEAKAAGVAYEILRDPRLLAQKTGRLLIADLNQDGVIEAASAWVNSGKSPVVGFVSHMDAEKIQAARATGIQTILARSAFVIQLPTLLKPQ